MMNDYYNNAEILNNMLNSMKFRNNAFINVTGDFKYNVQNVIVSNTSNVLKNMKRFFFIPRNYNVYSSVARYDFASFYNDYGFPPFSFNISERKKQALIFSKNHKKYVLGYDFVMDFDANDKTYQEVARIKNAFDDFNVPYILRFSGRGFHIIVPYKYLPEWFDKLNLETYKNCANVLKSLFDLSSLDMSIYDGRRVLKTAYSIDRRSGYVCLPLTDIEFERFNKSYCLPDNVIKMPDLYFRNAVLRKRKPDGFKKFLKKRCEYNG